jgi:hypothetical protein
VTHHTYQGEVVSGSIDTDWHVILKAIELFSNIFGVTGKPQHTPKPVVYSEVTIDLSSWGDPKPLKPVVQTRDGSEHAEERLAWRTA